MTHPIRDFVRPATPPEALSQLGRAQAAPLIFGPRRPPEPFEHSTVIVDLSALALDSLIDSGAVIRIGSQVPLQTVMDSAVTRDLAHGLLAQAAQLAAHRGLRQLATVCGALFALDGPPEVRLALLALDAAVVSQGAQTREIPLSQYRFAADELLVEVRVPRPAMPSGAALARVARSPQDQAIVAAAAVVTGQGARVAVAGASLAPILKAGASLNGLAAAVAAEAEPIADYRGSARYRKAMAEVLARRALVEAAQKKAQS